MTVHVCLSACVIQLENSWTDLDEILYGLYAIGGYPKLVLFNFVQPVLSYQLGRRTNL
jgi:hypothetical protein